MAQTTTIEQTVEIPATPAEVYEALINPEMHGAVTHAEATGGTAVGDSFTAWDGYIEGRHLELEPGRRIVQEWLTSEWPEGMEPSRLEITLEASGSNKTLLRLTQSNVPADQADDYTQGWFDYYWKPMTEYFEAR